MILDDLLVFPHPDRNWLARANETEFVWLLQERAFAVIHSRWLPFEVGSLQGVVSLQRCLISPVNDVYLMAPSPLHVDASAIAADGRLLFLPATLAPPAGVPTAAVAPSLLSQALTSVPEEQSGLNSVTTPFLDTLQVTGRPDERWLTRVQGWSLVWLVKENRYAQVTAAWTQAALDRSYGRIAFRRAIAQEPVVSEPGYVAGPTEIWWTDARGDGFDGKPLMMPVEGHCPPCLHEHVQAFTCQGCGRDIAELQARYPIRQIGGRLNPIRSWPNEQPMFSQEITRLRKQHLNIEDEPILGQPVETPQRSRLRRKHD